MGTSGLLLTWSLIVCGAEPARPEPSRFVYQKRCMGVDFTLVLYAMKEKEAESASDAAFATIDRMNDLFSDYDDQSELMRLCRDAKPGKPTRVSSELFEVLRMSQTISQKSAGAFDATVGPFVQLWRKARRLKRLPTKEQLESARSAVGYQRMRLTDDPRAVELTVPGMRLDLGGIAKGHAAQAALEELRKRGIRSALVNGSGDIAMGDPPPGREHWRIGVAPLDAAAAPSRFLLLSNHAVATSGDAWRFVEIEGRRYSHIIDPKTGLGLTRRSSVTVTAPLAGTADALASAASVLEPSAAVKLIDRTPDAACFIVRVENGA
ncbi:MAG: FAD:protein FMN transferase, partial [Planctomycetales bacterium]